MIEVYLINTSEEVSRNTEMFLYRFFNEEARKQLAKYRFDIDRKRSFYGKILSIYLGYLSSKDNSIVLNFAKNEFGKPYFSLLDNFHFNISHSGNWVVCACSSEEVGVDIEEIVEKNYDLNGIKDIYSQEEIGQIVHQKNFQDKLDLFYKYWTLKECYLKYRGCGFLQDVSNINFVFKEDEFKQPKLNQILDSPYFFQKKIDATHQLAICSKEKKEVVLKYISIETVSQYLSSIKNK